MIGGNLTVRNSKGEVTTAPLVIWLMALIATLDPEWKDVACAKAAELAQELRPVVQPPKIHLAKG